MHLCCKVARIDVLWVYKAFLILFLSTLYCILSKNKHYKFRINELWSPFQVSVFVWGLNSNTQEIVLMLYTEQLTTISDLII